MTRSVRPTRLPRFRGLSTLEMVLVLPILLFVMALMVNFGVAACWKIRSLSVAREAVWGTRWPRTGFCYRNADVRDPRPKYWPVSARAEEVSGGHVPELDDPRVDHAVARGPLPDGNQINADLLDPTRGLRRGSAQITREFPMLARLGKYDLQAETHLLDDKWRYPEMRMWSNVQRRIPVIYRLAKAPQSDQDAYLQAVMAVRNFPLRGDLKPLDRDDDFLRYKQEFGWSGGQPNFYPRLNPGHWRGRAFCSSDPSAAGPTVQDLIDRIQGNPATHTPGVYDRMQSWFRRMYQRAKRGYEARLNAIPPPPMNVINSLQSEISRLEQYIGQLN